MTVGGKGANLGELSKTPEIRVPDGFCISTEAFKRIIRETPSINGLFDKLQLLKVEDRDKIGKLSSEIRLRLEGIAFLKTLMKKLPVISPRLVKIMPMQYDLVQLQRIYRRPPLLTPAGHHCLYP